MSPKRIVRCAIYTRKSTEEGLEKEFNTLQAQREACEAFIKSQAGEGWIALRDAYDDGGFSGGSLERPALQRLLAEVDKGRIDIVVVYKVDRLTRSLADFAKIVERFETHNASFVSVTQSFNTATSMGRLTLNVLLSFAQFEREIAGERIRDKIAASRRKGMWTGGSPPLGYDIVNKKLVPNAAEAKTVSHIFKRYLELGSVRTLRDDLSAHNVVSKARKSSTGRTWGGTTLHRGALYTILQNRTYVGEMVHKGVAYPGEHKAIIPRELFDRVHDRLAGNRKRRRDGEAATGENLLTGLIFDARGNRMSPTHARKKDGRRYRYYVSLPLLTGEKAQAGAVPRVAGSTIETIVVNCLRRLLRIREPKSEARVVDDNHLIQRLVHRVEIHPRSVVIRLDRVAMVEASREADLQSRISDQTDDQIIGHLQTKLTQGEQLDAEGDHLVIMLPVRAKSRGGPRKLTSFDSEARIQVPRVDPALVKGIVRAHHWLQSLINGEVSSIDELARKTGQHRTYVRQVLRLAFLSPEITKLILQGRQPAELTQALLFRVNLPLSWAEQRRILLADAADGAIAS